MFASFVVSHRETKACMQLHKFMDTVNTISQEK